MSDADRAGASRLKLRLRTLLLLLLLLSFFLAPAPDEEDVVPADGARLLLLPTVSRSSSSMCVFRQLVDKCKRSCAPASDVEAIPPVF